MIWQLASSLLLISLLFRAGVASGQQLKRFDAKSYPAGSFQVSRHDYPIGKFTVRIIQAKRVYDASAPSPSYCRAWLDVTEGGKVLRQAYFDDIDPVGGSFGVFLPKRQPLSDYFVALKEGDYDGRLLLVGEDGSLTNLPGGGFFLTPDKRFVIGSHSSDYQSPFVIDVALRRLAADVRSSDLLPGDIYRSGAIPRDLLPCGQLGADWQDDGTGQAIQQLCSEPVDQGGSGLSVDEVFS